MINYTNGQLYMYAIHCVDCEKIIGYAESRCAATHMVYCPSCIKKDMKKEQKRQEKRGTDRIKFEALPR